MKKSTIFWIVGGIATAVGGYFLYKRKIGRAHV